MTLYDLQRYNCKSQTRINEFKYKIRAIFTLLKHHEAAIHSAADKIPERELPARSGCNAKGDV